MYAILGCTGQVGGATAMSLLAQGKDIRVIVREASKGEVWARRGAELLLRTCVTQLLCKRLLQGQN